MGRTCIRTRSARPRAARAGHRDLGHFDADLRAVGRFLVDILDGKIPDEQHAFAAARPFWGVQGAGYTVWKMAATIERRFGRARLVHDECDPAALLLSDYDRAAPAGGARWSTALIRRLR